MQGDIADFVLGDVGASRSPASWRAPARCRRDRPHAVISVTGRTVAQDLAVDFGAAAQRALPLFENQHPCALAEHEAVAGPIEGPRRVRRARRCGTPTPRA